MPLVSGLVGGTIAGAVIVALVFAPRLRNFGTNGAPVSSTGSESTSTATLPDPNDPRWTGGSVGAGDDAAVDADPDASDDATPASGGSSTTPDANPSTDRTPDDAAARPAPTVTATTPVRTTTRYAGDVRATDRTGGTTTAIAAPDRTPTSTIATTTPPVRTSGVEDPKPAPTTTNTRASSTASVGTGSSRPTGDRTATRTEAPVASTDDSDWPLLCGQVQDESGVPIAGARVLLADLDLGARTDRRGRFCVAAPPGSRTLSVVALGFTTHRRVVTVANDSPELKVVMKGVP